MTTAKEYANEQLERFLEELQAYLRLPGISTDAAYADDVRATAQWLVDHLESIGCTARQIEVHDQYPLVYAEWLHAGEGAATVLFYGHYDVQPAEDTQNWTSPPFEPERRDGKLYARGATDDKGQHFTHLKAVESLLASDETLPVNVKFIIEGNEESGSRGILQYVQQQGEMLQADVCVVSDTSMSKKEEPIIVNSLRGVVAFEVVVSGPAQDLHSGMYGGTVHNPVQALAEIIAKLHNPDGSVAVPGFYDDVRDLLSHEREQINRDIWDNVSWAEETGALVPWGEENFSLRERVGVRPTLEVNGMAGGYDGTGTKAIIPATARAKISCRLVADQNPDDIVDKVHKYLKKITPPTVSTQIVPLSVRSPAVLIETQIDAMQAAIRAYEVGWGHTPIFRREGGSIPVVGNIQHNLNIPVLLMGFGMSTDNLHAPNEHFHIDNFQRGIHTIIEFLNIFAQSQNSTTEKTTQEKKEEETK